MVSVFHFITWVSFHVIKISPPPSPLIPTQHYPQGGDISLSIPFPWEARLVPAHALFLKNKFIYLFIYLLFLAALGLRCCVRAFSSCGEGGLLFVAVRGLLITVAFLCCGARALGARSSVVVAHGLQWLWRTGFSGCGARA